MELIKLFVLGFSGYLLSGFHDVAMLYNKSFLKRVLSSGFFITALPYLFLFTTYKIPLPAPIIWILAVTITCFMLLLIYSVFIETALFSPRSGQLYTKGTYGFSRHPGFIWYTMVNFLIAVLFWNVGIAVLCLGLTACNLILITIEDTVLFPKMFPEYDDYKRRTPFFLSLHNFCTWRSAV